MAEERTWPEDWEDRRRGSNCRACAEGRPDAIPDGQRVFAGRVSDAYLSQNLVARGYTIVFWRGRHVADPTELTEDEACRYTSELHLVARGIEEVYQPAKLNLLSLGNSLPHHHTHIVPRYLDDPDPGAPPLFMMSAQAWPLIPDEDFGPEVTELRAAIRRLEAKRLTVQG
jgi:diadenosine tetraphosphate (Ap4A) HIT family hydrolase